MSTQLKEQPDYRVERADGQDWVVPRGKSVREVIAEAKADSTPRNTSGIIPFDKRCLVLHDPVETKVGSIIIPDSEADKRKFAQTTATVIAVGDMAWAEAKYDAKQFGVTSRFPEPGSRVIVGRYTGDVHKGADGKEYVIINDTDILAYKSEG